MKIFLTAFLKAQKKIESAVKDAKNPFFKSNYATLNSVLDACKKPLNDEGICIIQNIVYENGKTIVRTCLFHSESGEAISSDFALPDSLDIQKIGSAITYARRYSLQSMVSMGAEDDDGNSVKPKETTLPKGKFDEAMKSISNAKNKTELDKVKENLSLREWNDIEFTTLSNALKTKYVALDVFMEDK